MLPPTDLSLYWLDHIHPTDRPSVGDQAFFLSQLKQRDYPILPGFVVPSTAVKEFLKTIDWLEPLFNDLLESSLHLDIDNPRQLQAIAQQIRQAITQAVLPSEWTATLGAAVHQLRSLQQPSPASALIFRPSITLQSFNPLKVTGLLAPHFVPAQAEALPNALKQAWAELFRARNLLYWQRRRIHLNRLNFAVLVQPLPSAIASGTLEADLERFVVQATWGLGLSLAWGEVQPDSYQIHPATGEIQSQTLGKKLTAYCLNDGTEELFCINGTAMVPPGEQNQSSPLRTCILQEELIHRTALETPDLQQLITWAQQLRGDWGSPFCLEWTICRSSAPDTRHELYLTQIEDLRVAETKALAKLVDPKPALPVSMFPIQGKGASPGRAIAQTVAIANPQKPPTFIPHQSILVAPAISPALIPLLKQAAGIITEQDGLTSHGAILARELGIPAVVGVNNAIKRIRTGEYWLVDGTAGEIQPVEARRWLNVPAAPAVAPSVLPTIATQLWVNLSQSSSLERVKQLAIDGIGLLRSELMALEIFDHPSQLASLEGLQSSDFIERWYQQIRLFAAALAPRPVFYRSLDLREILAPENPAISTVRGATSYQINPTLFDWELAALERIHRDGFTNVRLILPFVRSVEEFAFCQSRIQARNFGSLSLWMMAEVPSVLFLLPDYVKAGVQGIAIGSNDLTQLLLGINRDTEPTTTGLNSHHPAVVRAIKQLIGMSQELGIPCSICGQAPVQYPELIESLVEWGITAISVELNALESTHQAIARAEQRLMLAAARLFQRSSS